MVKNEKGVWYYTTIYECPVCGRGETFRERMPAPKPEDWRDRYDYFEAYDWCDAL